MEKKALLVGINYADNDSMKLFGCVNDAVNTAKTLKTRGFSNENITILADSPELKVKPPTRYNILKELFDLIMSDADQLYFHYSGHGSQVRDLDGDEVDGLDEAIVPVDFAKNGVITDDELRGIITLLRPNQTLSCVIDACHSGSSLDLKYSLYKKVKTGEMVLLPDSAQRETRGKCIMLSGCADAECSADTVEQGSAQGALTASYLKVLSENDGISIQELLKKTRVLLVEKGYNQRPELSSGRDVSLNSKWLI